MNRRIGLVVNPVGDPGAAAELEQRLLSEGWDVDVEETLEDDPGRAMATGLHEAGCEVVVGVGGDGTVRACAEALAGTDVPLAVLPTGTGNLLAANLELPRTVDDLVEAILDGDDRVIDVGSVNGETFLIMAGAGLDTTIMTETDREAKDALGPAAYVLTSLAHLGDDPFELTMTIDDGEPSNLEVATFVAGNFGRILGPVDIFPDATPDDGELDVMAVRASGLAEWIAAARETFGAEDHSAHVDRWRARSVRIEFRAPRAYQLDGEDRPAAGRLDIDIRPRALRVRRAST